MPNGIDFAISNDDAIEYIDIHDGESKKQEIQRYKALSYIRPYLTELFSSLQYEGKIHIVDREAVDGMILSADDSSIKISSSGHELDLSWQQFAPQQFIEVLKYYIGLRSQQLDKLSG